MAETPLEFARYLRATLEKGRHSKEDTIRMMCKQFDEFLSFHKDYLAQLAQSTPRVTLASLSAAQGGPLGDSLMRLRCPHAVIQRKQHQRFAGINQIAFNTPRGVTHTAVSTVSFADVVIAGIRNSLECLVVDISIESMDELEATTTAAATAKGLLSIGFVCTETVTHKRLVELTLAADGAAWHSDGTFTSAIISEQSAGVGEATSEAPHVSAIGADSFIPGSLLSLTVERAGQREFLATLRDEALGIEDTRSIVIPSGVQPHHCCVAIACRGLSASMMVCVRPDPSFPPALPLSPSLSSREPSTIEHQNTLDSASAAATLNEFTLIAQGTTASALIDRIASESLVRIECESFAEGANAVVCDPVPMVGYSFVVSSLSESFRVGVVLGARADAERKRLCVARKFSDVGLSIGVVRVDASIATAPGAEGATSSMAIAIETKLSQYFTVPRKTIALTPSVTNARQVALRIKFDEAQNAIMLLDARNVDTMENCLAAESSTPPTNTFPILLATITAPNAVERAHFGCGCTGGGCVQVKRVALAL